jgi:ATP-dependent RNA helicase SUPV3L1/SUV3
VDSNQKSIYQEINSSLTLAREGFCASAFDDQDSNIRSVETAKIILETLGQIYSQIDLFLTEHPYLLGVYEKEFGYLEDLTLRERILETCFISEYLFSDKEKCPIIIDDKLDENVIPTYIDYVKEWLSETAKLHVDTQLLLKENFQDSIKFSDLKCQCVQCSADYRTKVREFVYDKIVKMMDIAEEKMFEMMLDRKIGEISYYFYELKKKIERYIHEQRFRLKRSTLNKLESELKSDFKLKFSHSSDLGKVYKEKLYAFFNSILTEMGMKLDLISEEEYQRFFLQIDLGIWRAPAFLEKDFKKLVNSVMMFKRKDISATILRDYLGQFWIHSEARKMNRKIVYHMGPTNSGKTYNAIEALCKVDKGCYLAPLRLLASELYDTMNSKGVKTSLLTGEEVVEVEGGTHYSSTIEMAKLHDKFDCVVIDEIQMITDTQRGWAWTRALVNMSAPEIHICGDASVLDLIKKILKLTGDSLEVHEYERKTLLTVEKNPITLAELAKHDALIVFSRRNALKYKMDLENLDFKVSIVYGRLSPEVRREQARKFDEGETDIMVSTDAIAMGMNLPVKRIIFSAVAKFINSKEYPLSPSEIKQIAGRAGRYGRFPHGTVTTLQRVENGLETIEEALECQLEQKELAMVGPDLEIFRSVNDALKENSLPELSLSEFLRLFNTMIFEKPFYCVDLKEMIEVAEMVEHADEHSILTVDELFGFACSPVNLGLIDHVQYYIWILNNYVQGKDIVNEPINVESDDIDYLETAIKCVELYQWLARHFRGRNFSFSEKDLLHNKTQAIEKLNELLSQKISKRCSSCGVNLDDKFRFNICEACFTKVKTRGRDYRTAPPRSGGGQKNGDSKKSFKPSGRPPAGKKKSKNTADSFKKFR